MTLPEQLDRRREVRTPATHLAHVEEYWYPPCSNHRTDDALGRTLDLSRGGLRLELDHALHACSRVVLDLALGESIVRVEGRIRWVRQTGPRWEMGIELAQPVFDEVEAPVA